MQASFEKIAGAAAALSKGGDISDQIQPMATMITQTPVYEANAQVVKTADEMIGTLLDTLA